MAHRARLRGATVSIRSLRERVVQTLAFEAGGLAIASPVYALIFDRDAAGSVLLIAALSFAMLVWMPLHNTLFDLAEWRIARRFASDRPHVLRLIHATSLEVSGVLVTVPLVMIIGGHGFLEALAIDLGLSVLYVVYGYAFHLAFDRLRPVNRTRPPRAGA